MRSDITRETLLLFIEAINSAPSEQGDPHTRVEVKEAIAKGLHTFTDGQLFDIVQRMGDREPFCEVSSFMHALCNLRPYYNRPRD